MTFLTIKQRTSLTLIDSAYIFPYDTQITSNAVKYQVDCNYGCPACQSFCCKQLDKEHKSRRENRW